MAFRVSLSILVILVLSVLGWFTFNRDSTTGGNSTTQTSSPSSSTSQSAESAGISNMGR